MTEIKTVYNIANLDPREINFVLSQIANRLDALEGLRGTPRFYANINAGGKKIQNVEAATANNEVLTYDAVNNLFPAGIYLICDVNPADLGIPGTWEEV